MGRLFWKIFAYFILIQVMVFVTVVLLSFQRDSEFPPLGDQNLVRQALAEYGRRASSAYVREGSSGADKFSRLLWQRTGIRVVLFDGDGRALNSRPIPKFVRHMVQRARHSGEVVTAPHRRRRALAAGITGSDGQRYYIAVVATRPPTATLLLHTIGHGFLALRLLLLLAVTAIICYLLARSLTSPIIKLRRATQRLAAGDLASRIGTDISGNNELAGLAGDFDHMADKIETLLTTRQTLLRDISHELRSPLTRLGIALELARQHPATPSQDKALARIATEAERMNILIGQLLELNRLDEPLTSPRHNFDLVELVQEISADATYEAQQRGVTITTQTAPHLPCCGNRALLGRALENVIRNAVHYTTDTVTVQIDTTEDHIVIRVNDNGSGVPQSALAKLFQPFYRVADARERSSGGSGIGLAIAAKAVQHHGGTITARNCAGGGLEVEMILPRQTGTKAQ